MPYGLITQPDITHLEARANKAGVDLMGDMKRAYERDEEALLRVFAYSLTFTKLDRDARTYGQLVYSSLLNMGEGRGVEAYSKLVVAQPPDVRQRIRDFLWYPVIQVPKPLRAHRYGFTIRHSLTLAATVRTHSAFFILNERGARRIRPVGARCAGTRRRLIERPD